MEHNDLITKALDLIRKHSVTAYEIESNTHLSAVGVQKIINGETKRPQKPTLETIISYITNKYEYGTLVDNSKLNPFVAKENIINVPYYDVDFAGGWDSDEIFSNQMPAFYISSPDFMKAQFACNLFGNSISNRIPSGAIIGLREIFDWQTYFPTNELYAVLTKNDLRTVKIVKRSQNDGYLTLIPDPKDQYNQIGYEPEEIPIAFISKFYQVVAWAQFERVAM